MFYYKIGENMNHSEETKYKLSNIMKEKEGDTNMEYEEVMKHVSKIYDALSVESVSKETENAFTEILDGYEQWCHL